MTDARTIPTADELSAACQRVAPHAHRTPVLRARYFDEQCGAELYFKCENMQRVGAFKFRGAVNAIFSLPDAQVARGVVTHSSGNHAQAVALAAQLRGIRARVVMPETAARVKLAAVAGYGAEVILCAPVFTARAARAAEVIAATGGTLIHPYNDPQIIAGQSTVAQEFFAEVPGLDLVVTPVGGGGLLSGTALAAHHLSPQTQVVGVEPEGADDAFRSLAIGQLQPAVLSPKTIADGLLGSLGELTFAIVRQFAREIVTVSDAATIAAMRLVFERLKIVIEPSSAVPLAAVLTGKIAVAGKRVGIILSGGNVDLDRLPWAA